MKTKWLLIAGGLPSAILLEPIASSVNAIAQPSAVIKSVGLSSNVTGFDLRSPLVQRPEVTTGVRTAVARSLLPLLLLLLLLTLPAAVQAQFNYTTNDGTITITGYTGPGGAVVIPDTI